MMESVHVTFKETQHKHLHLQWGYWIRWLDCSDGPFRTFVSRLMARLCGTSDGCWIFAPTHSKQKVHKYDTARDKESFVSKVSLFAVS